MIFSIFLYNFLRWQYARTELIHDLNATIMFFYDVSDGIFSSAMSRSYMAWLTWARTWSGISSLE